MKRFLTQSGAGDVTAHAQKGNHGRGGFPSVHHQEGGSRQLKPSFNESGPKIPSAPKKALRAAEAAGRRQDSSWRPSLQILFPPRPPTAWNGRATSPESLSSSASFSSARSTPTAPSCTICAGLARPAAPNRQQPFSAPFETHLADLGPPAQNPLLSFPTAF